MRTSLTSSGCSRTHTVRFRRRAGLESDRSTPSSSARWRNRRLALTSIPPTRPCCSREMMVCAMHSAWMGHMSHRIRAVVFRTRRSDLFLTRSLSVPHMRSWIPNGRPAQTPATRPFVSFIMSSRSLPDG